jgi:hypothetical protein
MFWNTSVNLELEENNMFAISKAILYVGGLVGIYVHLGNNNKFDAHFYMLKPI